jgi:nitrilase
MKVAAIQMASGSLISANLLEAEKLISNAVADGAKLIVLPENFGLIGVNPEDVVTQCETPGSGVLQDFLSQQARQHGIIIVGGSIPLAGDDDSHYRNTLQVYDRGGACVASYDKIHLFDVSLPDADESYHESAVIQPGNDVMVVEVDGLKLGLAICYDLRFPELFRLLVDKGAEVFVLPSAFTLATGRAHWHPLLKARAIENLCFMIASAQGGYHVNGRETYGHSLVCDPWGNVLDEIDSGSGYAIADINLDQQKIMRERFPVLNHRRLSCHPNSSEV